MKNKNKDPEIGTYIILRDYPERGLGKIVGFEEDGYFHIFVAEFKFGEYGVITLVVGRSEFFIVELKDNFP